MYSVTSTTSTCANENVRVCLCVYARELCFYCSSSTQSYCLRLRSFTQDSRLFCLCKCTLSASSHLPRLQTFPILLKNTSSRTLPLASLACVESVTQMRVRTDEFKQQMLSSTLPLPPGARFSPNLTLSSTARSSRKISSARHD